MGCRSSRNKEEVKYIPIKPDYQIIQCSDETCIHQICDLYKDQVKDMNLCTCWNCSPKYHGCPKTVVAKEAKCDICRIPIKLNGITAITWISNWILDPCFIRNETKSDSPNISRIKGFCATGHGGHESGCSFLCEECQEEVKIDKFYFGDISDVYHNSQYPSLSIPSFSYINHDDKKIYHDPGITRTISHTDLAKCLLIYLRYDNTTDSIVSLLSLTLRLIEPDRYGRTLNAVELLIKEILTDTFDDSELNLICRRPDKKKLISLLQILWKRSEEHLLVTKLPPPVMKIINDYSPIVKYSDYLPELPS